MKKLVASVKARPLNLVLIVLVLGLYFANNLYFKSHTTGHLRYFLVCHFNDLICPLFFLSYCNLLLITVGKELRGLVPVMLMSFGAALVWELLGPVLKAGSVSDPVDVLFYMLGGFLYWLILPKKGVARNDSN